MPIVTERDMVDVPAVNALSEAHGGHWGEHPVHRLDEWKRAVGDGDTRLGYWEWVADVLSMIHEGYAVADAAEAEPV